MKKVFSISFVIGIIASLITILGFLTGKFTINQITDIFNSNEGYKDSKNNIKIEPSIRTAAKPSSFISGRATLGPDDGYSFNMSKVVDISIGDFKFAHGQSPCFWGNDVLFIEMGPIDYDELLYAPSLQKSYFGDVLNYKDYCINIKVGYVYCFYINRGIGYYGKLRIIDVDSSKSSYMPTISFEYTYQQNGTSGLK